MPLLAASLLLLSVTSNAPSPARWPVDSVAVVEIRTYNLKPGVRERFHALFVRDVLPLLARWKVDVVAYGPSLHDQDTWTLMRGFPGVRERASAEDAFYASAEWRDGPRAAVLADIESYTTLVVRVDPVTLAGLRHTMTTTATQNDLVTLMRLNDDYIGAAKASDVARFSELLADEFLCSLPDGSLIDRAQFLANTARPYTLRDLDAHEVKVRIIGDVAIVHARTTFVLPNGKPGSGRYTDIWARQGGTWRAVAAHVTRNTP
jgi:ketosteroid isomerase-like protein